jgi:hypothetical protein
LPCARVFTGRDLAGDGRFGLLKLISKFEGMWAAIVPL